MSKTRELVDFDQLELEVGQYRPELVEAAKAVGGTAMNEEEYSWLLGVKETGEFKVVRVEDDPGWLYNASNFRD